jgi:hypothetical protein
LTADGGLGAHVEVGNRFGMSGNRLSPHRPSRLPRLEQIVNTEAMSEADTLEEWRRRTTTSPRSVAFDPDGASDC